MLAKNTHEPMPQALDPLTFTVKRLGALTLPERAAWQQLRAQNPALYSPYFDISYSLTLASLRDDCYVVMAARAEQPVAFLPYQAAGRIAAPIGAPMTDYHGVIKAPQEPIDTAMMLKAANLGGFNFSSLIDEPLEDSPKQLTVRSELEAAVMDISGGAKAWRDARDGSYRRSLKSLRRRIRKTESEHGERRFVFGSKDKAVFDTLMSWKREQFKRTGKYDVLSAGWTLDMLKQLRDMPENELHCDMHALYFDDQLAAVDFGMVSGGIYHSWIVAYDSRFASTSPGLQLLEGLIDEAEALGYSKIDLGAGTDGYKKNYATDPLIVKSGFAAVQGLPGTLLSFYGWAEEAGGSRLGGLLAKLRRRYTQIANCDPSFRGRFAAMLSAFKTYKS